jgi:hypothetical protein
VSGPQVVHECGVAATRHDQPITALVERAHNWLIGSDPKLLRLRMASRVCCSPCGRSTAPSSRKPSTWALTTARGYRLDPQAEA